jgi:hypothetical protein
VIKGTKPCTKLDFYYVASPSPFDHRQITWPIYTLNPQLQVSQQLLKMIVGKRKGYG